MKIDINTTRIVIDGGGVALDDDGRIAQLIYVFPRRPKVREAVVKLAQLLADNQECQADPRAFAKAAGIGHTYREPFVREFNALMRLKGGSK